MSFAVFIAVLAAQAAAAPPLNETTSPDPKAMSYNEIKQHNAKLEKGDPHFIRCVKSARVGSLVPREMSCRTNEQWKIASAKGNQNARDTVESMQSRASSNSN